MLLKMKDRVQMDRFMQVQSLHMLLHSSHHNDVLFSLQHRVQMDRFMQRPEMFICLRLLHRLWSFHRASAGEREKKTNVLHFWTSECILSLVQICILRIKQFCEQMSKNGNFPSLFSPGGPSKILQGNTTSASMERVFRTNSTKTIRK